MHGGADSLVEEQAYAGRGPAAERGGTLNLRPCRPATDLRADLTVSHLRRLNRSRHWPSRLWYTRLSSSTLKSRIFTG